jgi:DNA polymerase-3 subunit epsilon
MFVAIDVETANANYSSICQLGVVVFDGGREIHAECHLIDPEDYFDAFNVGIHGIDEEAVAGCLPFRHRHDWLLNALGDRPVISHGPFDRTSLMRACDRHGLASVGNRWLDTIRVARRAWPDRASYSLPIIAAEFGIAFRHHDALEDARAAGVILHRAMEETGLDLDGWFRRVELPVSGEKAAPIRREAVGDGPLSGQVVVFTGKLELGKSAAADLAAAAGADVHPGVTRHTTMLVLGDRDVHFGTPKSAKHLKAEAMLAAGHIVRIVPEGDFMATIGAAPPSSALAVRAAVTSPHRPGGPALKETTIEATLKRAELTALLERVDMATDWMTLLRERGERAKHLAKDVPAALADPSLTLDQCTRLYQALEELAQQVEQLVEAMDDDGADEALIEAAESLEEFHSDLAARVANKMIALRGHP